MDLQVFLKQLSNEERVSEIVEGESARIRSRVEKARTRQIERFHGTEISCNAAIPGGKISEFCRMSPEGETTYRNAISRVAVSTRTCDRLAKVSRTIADLAGEELIQGKHISEATKFVAGGILQT